MEFESINLLDFEKIISIPELDLYNKTGTLHYVLFKKNSNAIFIGSCNMVGLESEDIAKDYETFRKGQNEYFPLFLDIENEGNDDCKTVVAFRDFQKKEIAYLAEGTYIFKYFENKVMGLNIQEVIDLLKGCFVLQRYTDIKIMGAIKLND